MSKMISYYFIFTDVVYKIYLQYTLSVVFIYTLLKCCIQGLGCKVNMREYQTLHMKTNTSLYKANNLIPDSR